MSELKPCPFCGGEAEFSNNGLDMVSTPKDDDQVWDIWCCNEDCWLSEGADWCLTKKFAAKLWNKRA